MLGEILTLSVSFISSTAWGHQLCVPAAGVQGHRRGDVASCLWRLQCVHICIRPDRIGKKLHHDGTTGAGPGRNHSSGNTECSADQILLNYTNQIPFNHCEWNKDKSFNTPLTLSVLFQMCEDLFTKFNDTNNDNSMSYSVEVSQFIPSFTLCFPTLEAILFRVPHI